MGTHSTTRTVRNIALVAALLLGSYAPLSAQHLQGVVRDEFSHQPVKGVKISLVGARGRVVGRTITGADGRFEMSLPRFSAYAIEARALGYKVLVTHIFVADTTQQVVATLNLAPAPVALKGLSVTTTAIRRELEKVGFYRRKKLGFGYYLTAKQIEDKTIDRVTDAFYGIPSVRVVCDPAGVGCDVTARGAPVYCSGGGMGGGMGSGSGAAGGCSPGLCFPSVYLDGTMIRHGGNSALGGGWTGLFSPYDVAGIEVYAHPGGLPAFASGSDSPCGTILIWTKTY